jgi:hypothetical protein
MTRTGTAALAVIYGKNVIYVSFPDAGAPRERGAPASGLWADACPYSIRPAAWASMV